ncbi:MAG: sulfur oxidation c-type cytochrome SoxX [Proteobacteria bacterium]|nr:sulfur oxidation c-type cytochrome SoxX [Pseudomonadota bacterium]
MAILLSPINSKAETDSVRSGRELTHNYDYGNCLACHSAPNDKLAVTLANIAPPLKDMKRRFPSREVLFKQIWDARDTYPDTIMPPFGAHEILSEAQIQTIIDYLYTL